MEIAISKNKVPIRLSDERWKHITTGHPEVSDYYFEILETLENPDVIYSGKEKELIAFGKIGKLKNKFLVVIYKEISSNDGFIITAFVTNKHQKFTKKKKIWESAKQKK